MTNKRILLAAIVILMVVPALAAQNAPRAGKAIKLFNGKNLDGFYTWLEKQGKNQDPDRVFTVHDGMIHVSGTEFCYFATEQEYENYRLTAEFKWGEKTHAPREGKARDSGILYHFVGPDKIWPKSIEFQIIEGGTGDIILVDGGAITAGGKALTEGRINRMGKGEWKDVVGYRNMGVEIYSTISAVNYNSQLVSPADIELMEVYTGVARLPAEYINDACAVIAVWTK